MLLSVRRRKCVLAKRNTWHFEMPLTLRLNTTLHTARASALRIAEITFVTDQLAGSSFAACKLQQRSSLTYRHAIRHSCNTLKFDLHFHIISILQYTNFTLHPYRTQQLEHDAL